MKVRVVVDATGRNLVARMVEGGTIKTCLAIMREVVEGYGLPGSIRPGPHLLAYRQGWTIRTFQVL
jgi:hypothetical protein